MVGGNVRDGLIIQAAKALFTEITTLVLVYTSGYYKLKRLYEFTLRRLGNVTYIEDDR